MAAKKGESKIDREEVKKKAQDIGKTIKGYLDKGLTVSKKGIKTAGVKINDLGDLSVIKIEIQQLKKQRNKDCLELGKICAAAFGEGKKSITAKTAGVPELLESILQADEKIGKKEEEFKKIEKKLSSKK